MDFPKRKIIDGHIHYAHFAYEPSLIAVADKAGFHKLAVVCTSDGGRCTGAGSSRRLCDRDAVARILDGVVDIPIAGWTDNLKSRWGRRRPLMILGFIPTILSFLLLWYPPLSGNSLGVDGHWGNAIFIAAASSLYFFFHTLIIAPYFLFKPYPLGQPKAEATE